MTTSRNGFSSSSNGGPTKLKQIDCQAYPMDSVFENYERGDVSSSGLDTRERSKISKWFGKLLIILTLISFILVGLILNLAQLVLCLSSKLSNNHQWLRWHKWANGYMIYLLYTQPIALIYHWPRVDLKIYLSDKAMADDVKKKVLDHMGNIGSYKCFAKDELKWLPVIGWSFWMSDLIYVRRDWQQDKLSIEKKLDELLVYDQILLGIFAEGTRLTKEKYTEAKEFAASKGLEPYKYHLFPRARGFNYTLRHYLRAARSKDSNLSKDMIRLINLEIVLPDRPNFKHFLEGSYFKADIFCEEVQISEDIIREAVESKDAESCLKMKDLLQKIYRRKDELIDEYKNDGGFWRSIKKSPNGGFFPIKSGIGVTCYWLLFMSLTYGSFVYLSLTVFAKSLIFWTIVALLLTSGMLMLRRIEKESKPNNLRMLKNKARQICDPKAA